MDNHSTGLARLYFDRRKSLNKSPLNPSLRLSDQGHWLGSSQIPIADSFWTILLTISTEASTGSVLFGGIDTAKFSGNLISVQIYPSILRGGGTVFTSFTVAFTSLSATSSSGTDQVSLNLSYKLNDCHGCPGSQSFR